MIFGFKSDKPARKDPPRESVTGKLRSGLQRTRSVLFSDLQDLLPGRKSIDQNFLDNLEEHLISADLGIDATATIINTLSSQLKRSEIDQPHILIQTLHAVMLEILKPVDQPLCIPPVTRKPYVVLMAGVNGSGKTTSAGKLANYFLTRGQRVMLAAGDTFRAAAVEQLQAWGERNRIAVIAQQNGADPAAVIYDALQSARARDIDILIADTAGRLHTQGNLMEELKKVRRVITKFDPAITPECLLVIDAGTGQNALTQANQFNQAIGVTGIMLTKLDGTAKGGVIFALAMATGIPIRFIGIGEQIDDLQVFNRSDFVTALLALPE